MPAEITKEHHYLVIEVTNMIAEVVKNGLIETIVLQIKHPRGAILYIYRRYHCHATQ